MAKDGSEKAGGLAATILNPNWANLQEKLKSRCNPKPLPNSATLDNVIRSTSALGKRKERPNSQPAASLSTPAILAPTSDDCSLTEALAMDCEMVGVSFQGNQSALGRVTLVNPSTSTCIASSFHSFQWFIIWGQIREDLPMETWDYKNFG
ncbi:RNA exonuclease 4-like [Phalaenopsis equestris]|uniref:RNA exonuclease 4-like n=1 Tax=Phalaenopsis equestris TaxID=78828 RepID=UPI0009E48672|nr:RNA exonuclease 4-like [Phalaenopsis equestris]